MADFYVKAIYPFSGNEANELTLRKNDIILVTNVIDAEWYHGKCNGKTGNFPGSFVASIDLPKVNASEKIYASIGSFDGPEKGDLSFHKGEIIIGTQPIDFNWSNGYKPGTNEHGIFPLTHVTQLIDLDAKILPTKQSPLSSSDTTNKPEEYKSAFNFDIFSSNSITLESNDPQKTFKNHARRSSFSLANTSSRDSTVTPYAKSLHPFVAMYPYELSFKENEIIRLIKHLNGGWTEGEIDNKKGIFPTNFVDIIVDCLPPTNIGGNMEEELYGRVTKDFKATLNGEINLQEGDTVTILRSLSDDYCEVHHDDGRFGYCPKHCIEIFGGEPASIVASPLASNTIEDPSISQLINKTSVFPKPYSKMLLPDLSSPSLSTSTPDLKSSRHFESLRSKNNNGSLSPTFSKSKTNFANSPNSITTLPKSQLNVDSHRSNQNFRDQLSHIVTKPKDPKSKETTALSSSYNGSFNSPVVRERGSPKVLPRRVAPLRPKPRTINVRSSSSVSGGENLIEFSPEQEIFSPTLGSSPLEGEDNLKKGLRQKTIEEIIQTERDYYECMKQCYDMFSKPSELPYGFDAKSLLGNTIDVITLSKKLLESFEENAKRKSFEEQRIGICFIHHSDEMKKVYAEYCSNHDNVIGLIEKYKLVPEIFAFINSQLQIMRDKRSIFDLESVLIKPVQRILKYPLFLSSLDKATPCRHADKNEISLSLRVITEIASYINEMKRKKDLVHKYKLATEKTGKLTMHSTKKKLSRFGQMIVGVQTVDESFNREVHKFFYLNNLVKIIVKNISQYVEQVQECGNLWENLFVEINNYYVEDKADFDLLAVLTVNSSIARFHLANFRMKVETEVVPSLNSLSLMLNGPDKLIKKKKVPTATLR